MKSPKIALLIALAGCASSRPSGPVPEPEPATSAAPQVSSTSPAPVAVRSAAALDAGTPDAEALPPTLSRRIELREPGKEPRRALRHSFVKGSRQKLRVEILTRLLEEQRIAAEARVVAPLEVTIAAVRDDGSAEFRYELGPPVTSGGGAAPLTFVSGDAGSRHLSGSVIVGPGGELRGHRPDPPANADAPGELLESLFSSVIELPPQPVGPGGRWELVLEATSGEIAVASILSYDLVGFAGPRAKIRMSQNQQVRVGDGGATNQHVTPPSTGEWSVELGRVFPVGRQVMKAAIASDISGDLHTEIRLVPR